MVKVSVIIPVYNGEKHLEQCLDSVCGQTLRDIEIICVDDGSSDDSMKILKSYQDQDERIQIYQQDHKYAGVARNLGKSHAVGEYLVFWDCDDFFDLQALEKLYQKMKQVDADVGVCGGNEYIESKQKAFPHPSCLNMKRVPKVDPFNRYTNPDYYLNFTNEAAWDKIFKRDYIEKLGLNFQPLRNANDVYFTMNALGLADRITCLDEALVTYRIDRDSGLVSSVSKSPLNSIQAWIDVAENLEKYDGFGEKSFSDKALGSIIYILSNLRSWTAFSQAINALKEYGLKKMHIIQQEDKYYYGEWHTELVNHLYSDTAEEIAVFLANSRYTQYYDKSSELRDAKLKLKEQSKKIKELEKVRTQKEKIEKENNSLKQEINGIRSSWTFKTGRAIVWIPAHLKKIFSK